MAISFELEAEVRQDKGKGASRRLRRNEQVPAILYGAGKDAVPLLLDHNKVITALQHESFYSHILTLKINKKSEKVILKDLQRHPYKARIMHMDFLRVKADEKIKMHIPLHFKGAEEAPGVKEGGLVSHVMSDVEVICLPKDLPEFIEVDLSNLALDQLLHLSDLKLPSGVEIVALSHDSNLTVASIHLPRIEEEPPAAEEGEGEGEGEGEAEAAAAGEEGAAASGEKPAEEKKEDKKEANKEGKK